jgi:hypothetical protein
MPLSMSILIYVVHAYLLNQTVSAYILDLEVAIVKGYPIEGGFAIDFFLCIFA